MLKTFNFSLLVTAFGFSAAFYYGSWEAVILTAILAVMEVSLSIDNAIVNASILKDMEPKWQQRFLTWGILVAVFGMRLIFPIVLVAFATHLNSFDVLQLALHNPELYSKYLMSSHGAISAFGGMFLLMVFLGFILDPKRNIHWLGYVEKKIGVLGNLESIEVIVALLILVTVQSIVPHDMRATILLSGIAGLSTFVVINSLTKLMSSYTHNSNFGKGLKKTGIMSFVYLEVLDASFSFDGVIGAFAITKDIIIIMIGLGIGAVFVRSLTVLLVKKRTLQNYIYLEHGAHYALGALAFMMLYSIVHHVPEVIIGGVGIVLISLSYFSSVKNANINTIL